MTLQTRLLTLLISVVSSAALPIYAHTLNKFCFDNLKITEIPEPHSLEVSGSSNQSALKVRKCRIKRHGHTITLTIYPTLLRQGQHDFKYTIPLPPGVDSVVLDHDVIWDRSAAFRN